MSTTSIARNPSAPPRGLHRFATVLACLVVLLIAAGALVKSKEAGLSVPDWPLSYGSFSPPHWWRIDTVRAEHGHRLFAGTIALLTVALAVWTTRVERRAWVRRVAWSAVGAVVAQALLGGITVLLFLPPAVSIAHAGLAELFLCLVVTVAVATSNSFGEATLAQIPLTGSSVAAVRALATATTAFVYLQILLGAVMRHNGAGLAIPTFPLAWGRLVPARFTFAIAIHYAHRVGALVVALAVLTTATAVLRRHRGERTLALPALAMVGIVAVQISLGALVVLTRRAVLPNTVHVATGASLLATSLVLTLQSWRLARGQTSAVGTKAEATVEAGAPRRTLEAAREALS
ncbi:MAG TPA: COX15/CtaA family protein [Thermoanaerobaculia bacterium]|nr:COX15/CtaA family protein [Thermoanaerobaculia bacterium]